MYDRAPRDLVKTFGSTPGNVGPGSYDPNGYAPFLSMTGRETFLAVNDQTIAAPGPGHYDPHLSQDYVKGGKTLANRSKRFQDQPIDTPGPGTYGVEKYTEFRATKSAPTTSDKDKSGLLMTNRIKFHRKPEAPSIPMPGQAYGYEECDDEARSTNRDVSLGPAFYTPAAEDTKPTKTYKGVHFGKLTSQRLDLSKGKMGPGPGEYEPYLDSKMKAENANIAGEYARFEAKIPRYHESIVKEEEKKAIPGPGKYDVKGGFDPDPPKVNTEGIEVEHPPFMSQSKRFTPNKKQHLHQEAIMILEMLLNH
ncbi:hypothetical protein KUTeg_003969 [Tegillarca granosa]|uniref:Sperm-tail PG-rich repeat-containing protein 2 n=1 Tax=Tegillarca granosa TaxID=220873 RepID=A0ABQ9FNP8_TEGGR|nr:hypothetical protein KUTeg_003969 [Tegillarca granosa]